MMVVVSYDVETLTKEGRRRLRRISRLCLNYGQRVQFSVFECNVDPAQWTVLRSQLLETYDPTTDSLRFYFLGKSWQNRIEHVGAKQVLDLEGPLIM